MMAVAERFKFYQFVIAGAPSFDAEYYKPFLNGKKIPVVFNATYDLLSHADAAIVASGTATLETALFGVPEIVCYKGSAISYQIAKRLVKVKYICLVNLIMDKPVVKELIQDELTAQNLQKELTALLNDKARRGTLATDYAALKQLLSRGGHASANAAESITRFLNP